MQRAFASGELDDDLVLNMDETHFIVNMDDGKTLDVKGATSVKYHDVVNGGEGMTMVVTLRGGASARLEVPMLIFQNETRSYPMRGLADDVPGVTYRTGPRGWMDRRVFAEWLREDRCIKPDRHARTQVVFVDNAAGHREDASLSDELSRKRVDLRFLPANSTDLCQPADANVIQMLKKVWRDEWEKEKLRLASEWRFSNVPNGAGEWSGKLKQPGKRFFLSLAARCCRQVSEMRDEDNVSRVRKSMIRCGLGKNLNGVWVVRQLFPHLQELVAKRREHFDGKEPLDFCEVVV